MALTLTNNMKIRLIGCVVVSVLCHGLFLYSIKTQQAMPDVPILTATINYLKAESQRKRSERREKQERQHNSSDPQPQAPANSTANAHDGEEGIASEEKSAGPVSMSSPGSVDPVVMRFWEDDVESRIKQAGQRFFGGQPGRARVSMLLSAAGELIDLEVTGGASDMAEMAIRSVPRWPRFEGESRRFRRTLAFVIA